MAVKTLQQAFAGGEVSPDFLGRVSDARYQMGLATCRNFIALPHGPAVNRPGFKFVRQAESSVLPGYLKRVRLIPFVYNAGQTVVIEMGAGYLRFHTEGATIMSGGSPYTVGTPWTGLDIFAFRYTQSNDVMTFVHPQTKPYELRRVAADDWELEEVTFGTTTAAPTLVSAFVSTGSGSTSYSYVVTQVENGEESLASAVASCNNDLTAAGAANSVTWWETVTSTRYFNVYKADGNVYGYIGTASETNSFRDANITPDISRQPPKNRTRLNTGGYYPGTVTYYQQRKVFGGSALDPQGIWTTRPGTEANATTSFPSRDDDAISTRIASRQAERIQHLVPMNGLLVLTTGSEYRLAAVDGGALTPSNISIEPQSYVGAADATPQVTNTTVLYAAARGGHVRELGYSDKVNGFATGDLSLRATHLFDGLTITDMALQRAPHQILWCVSSNGRLLGMTYLPEQEVLAWHWHDTDGEFESVCCVAEGVEDAVYAVVVREIDGETVRYVERMESRAFDAIEDAFFVDCGLTYDGSAATIISGLDHLEGKTVSILADGAVQPQQVVTDGEIVLDEAASLVHVGLPITAEIQTLPFAMQVDSALGQGRAKSINAGWIRVHRSSAFKIGPDADSLVEAKVRTTEAYGSPPALRTGVIEVKLKGGWTMDGQVVVRQEDPLPLSLVSMTLEVAMGG